MSSSSLKVKPLARSKELMDNLIFFFRQSLSAGLGTSGAFCFSTRLSVDTFRSHMELTLFPKKRLNRNRQASPRIYPTITLPIANSFWLYGRNLGGIGKEALGNGRDKKGKSPC